MCNHFPNVCQVGFICARPGPKRAHVIIYVHFCLVVFSMDPAPLCMPAFIRHPVALEALGADLTSDNSSRSPNPISHERSSQGQGHGQHRAVLPGVEAATSSEALCRPWCR